MNNLIMGGIDYLVNQMLHWIIWGVGIVADGISHLALLETQLPWVTHVKADIDAVAWSLLGIAIAYKVVQSYIFWNEGTADPEGSILGKSILRAIMYMSLSGTLSLMVFQWGISFAALILSAPMMGAAQSFHHISGNVAALPGAVMGLQLALSFGLIIGVALLIVVCFQVAIRGAELVVYYLAAPLVALGQLSPSGGTWSAWWQNLVVLSLSQAVQMLCFMGLMGTTQLLTSPVDTRWIATMLHQMPISAPVAMVAAVAMAVVNTILALLLMVGWMVVAIRGPHLLKQWSYHSGVGGGMMYAGQQVTSSKIGNKFRK